MKHEKINDIRENGEFIYSIGGKGSISDYNYCSEEFFVRDGNYFVIGTGGAGSKYRKGSGTTAVGAVKVFPVSKEYAIKRIQADKDGFIEDQYEPGNFFRYTEDGDIETAEINII